MTDDALYLAEHDDSRCSNDSIDEINTDRLEQSHAEDSTDTQPEEVVDELVDSPADSP